MSKPYLVVKQDLTHQVNDLIKRFRFDRVLVGIPAAESPRATDPKEKQQINNATILAINEFGSPGQNIPARPVMKIGIKLAQDAIAEQFKLAVQSVLKSGLTALNIYYERAGTIAASSIKRVINQQIDIDPPAESTLKARKRKGFRGSKALVVTGQLRNAITYVVKRGL